nr:PREDICTED: protein transport protein Sec61 subunit beta isoform X1 [Bos mutus]
MWPQSPSLSCFLPGAPIRASRSFIAFPSVPMRVPVSAVRARNLGAVRRRSPVSVFVFLCSLARPPVALTWAPQDALPAKQWRPGQRDPPSGRGRMPAVEQGAQAVRPQRALGGCGDSTQRIHQGSKWALFQYWL